MVYIYALLTLSAASDWGILTVITDSATHSTVLAVKDTSFIPCAINISKDDSSHTLAKPSKTEGLSST